MLQGRDAPPRPEALLGNVKVRSSRLQKSGSEFDIPNMVRFLLPMLFGIEYALFWAVLIAFLNYIPYIGSLVGVIFPVLLSLAQFGELGLSILVALALTTAQVFVGFYLEPRMMGRAFNLSPLVVLLALAFWSTLWGIAGAVLAVPMTASLVLVFAEIRTTRPIAVLLSGSGRV